MTASSGSSSSRRRRRRRLLRLGGRGPTTVDAYAARLEQAGVQVTRGTRALADERRVAGLIAFDDPIGNRLEIFHGAEVATDPFKPAATFPASAPARWAWAMRCCTSKASTT